MRDEKDSNLWDKYKVAFIAAAVVTDILLAGIFFTRNDDKVVTEPQEVNAVKIEKISTTPALTPIPAPSTQINFDVEGYPAGQYKVGRDIPPGEYLAVGEGYIELTKSPTGDIMFNDNFKNYRYIEGRDGEYIRIDGVVRLFPVNSAAKIEVDLNNVSEGQYKVGRDIPPGEYKLALEDGGYFAIFKNAHDKDKNLVANGYVQQSQNRYVKVSDGQYLQIRKGVGTLVK